MTTSGKKYTSRKDGTVVKNTKRVRYICYAKTRKQKQCNNQTGYTQKILDGVIRDVLHCIFDRLAAIPESEIVGESYKARVKDIRAAIKKEQAEYNRAATELKSLKGEIVKAINGGSVFTPELLNEAINAAQITHDEVLTRLNDLTDELQNSEQLFYKVRAQYNDVISWSKLFDKADLATQKMIVSYLIERVEVFTDYKLHIDFKIDLAQFNIELDEFGVEMAQSA